MTQEADRLAAFECQVSDASGLVSSAHIRLALSDFPDEAARQAARASLGRIGFAPVGADAPA
jgi:hypothetical protein